jgi:hypothetical protein
MRKDFGKVVIERPRRGSGARNAKVREFGRMVSTEDGMEYEGFTKIPCSFKAYRVLDGDSKEFTDVLGPIRGFLKNSVGRLWDDVWSEMKQTLGRSSWPVQHILKDHVDVERCTFRSEAGNVWCHNRYGESRITGENYRSREFYVEPETGILRFQERKSYHGRLRSKPDPNLCQHPDGRWFARINGLWFLGHYEPWAEELGITAALAWPDTRKERWVKEKSASKKELRILWNRKT